MLKRNITCRRVPNYTGFATQGGEKKNIAFSSWQGKKPDRMRGKQVFWVIVKEVSWICAGQNEANAG